MFGLQQMMRIVVITKQRLHWVMQLVEEPIAAPSICDYDTSISKQQLEHIL